MPRLDLRSRSRRKGRQGRGKVPKGALYANSSSLRAWGGSAPLNPPRKGSCDMAIYHLNLAPIRRHEGGSAVAHVAYMTATRARDERTGDVSDYSRKSGVLDSGVVGWNGDAASLAQSAEFAETRGKAVVGRRVIIALPHELPLAEQRAAVEQFAQQLHARHGCGVAFALHAPDAHGDERNAHAHVFLTARRVGPDGSSLGEKTRELDRIDTGSDALHSMRSDWEKLVNDALARQGHRYTVDRRSHAAKAAAEGLPAVEPLEHLGPARSAVERRGGSTRAGRRNAARVAFRARVAPYFAAARQAAADLVKAAKSEAAIFARAAELRAERRRENSQQRGPRMR